MHDAPWFGGWSGIEVEAQGTRMTVISDRGHLVRATLRRTDGRITGIGINHAVAVKSPEGQHLRKLDVDAEGLAIGADGSAFISFEHSHRIMQVDLSMGRTFNHIALPFRNTLDDNAGIEALAITSDGTLLAIPEKASSADASFPLYAYANGQWWITARIPQRGPFVPVGADIDSKGRLWVLERALTLLGFRSRIRLFVLNPRAPREYTLLTTPPGLYDNLEGISVWRDKSDQMYVTLVSDDNFLRFLRSQIVEYRVEE